MIFTVYAITNSITGKQYVGQTGQPLQTRFKNHLNYSRTSKGKSLLWDAIRQDGGVSFTIRPLAETEDRAEASRLEQAYILSLKTNDGRYGYNTNAVPEVVTRGWKWKAESKKRLSALAMGNTRGLGRTASESRKEKVRIALMGHSVSQETRDKIRASMLASDKCRGFTMSAEAKAKIAAANRGKHKTAEQREVTRKIMRAYNSTPERRKQLSEQAKAGWAKRKAEGR